LTTIRILGVQAFTFSRGADSSDYTTIFFTITLKKRHYLGKNVIILVKTRLFVIKSDNAKNSTILVNTRLFGIKSDYFGKKCVYFGKNAINWEKMRLFRKKCDYLGKNTISCEKCDYLGKNPTT
jgi:hypothetical protein